MPVEPATYDQIVVGAGAAGCVLAARLSEDSTRRVLLIEAGPDYPSFDALPKTFQDAYSIAARNFPNPGHDWELLARAIGEREIDYPRGKLIGGSSTTNGCIAIRGTPDDYDEWARLGCDEWGWEACLPYFRKLEDDLDFAAAHYHGAGGPLPIVRWTEDQLEPVQAGFLAACVEQGLPVTTDHNAPDATGVGSFPMNRDGRRRVSTAIGYLHPARGRRNLELLAGSEVVRVLLDGTRTIGVEVADSDGVRELRAHEVILAAGAIHSPALLQRSGIGPAGALAEAGVAIIADLPGVGANLCDHPFVSVACAAPAGWDLDQPQMQFSLRTSLPESWARNDVQYTCSSWADLRPLPDIVELLGGLETVYAVTPFLGKPKSSGSVRIVSTDHRVQPRIELNYLGHADDRRLMRAAVRLAWEIVSSSHLSSLGDGPVIVTDEIVADDASLDGVLDFFVTTGYHCVGTAKMGADDDPSAVVDQQGRVRGFEGLRVADASIMPTVPSGNTHLPSVMIAEKLADVLRAS
ncbi:MAG TPA: GMC family oxidoreductase N-terminal domain-containing protein [Solirubrobacteraceae bacterium]|nr:GMC family oxidoreductase N-terminal domain-containing protein [Solirubrobacteraceae bacterium]